jgi:hypothetical protein
MTFSRGERLAVLARQAAQPIPAPQTGASRPDDCPIADLFTRGAPPAAAPPTGRSRAVPPQPSDASESDCQVKLPLYSRAPVTAAAPHSSGMATAGVGPLCAAHARRPTSPTPPPSIEGVQQAGSRLSDVCHGHKRSPALKMRTPAQTHLPRTGVGFQRDLRPHGCPTTRTVFRARPSSATRMTGCNYPPSSCGSFATSHRRRRAARSSKPMPGVPDSAHASRAPLEAPDPRRIVPVNCQAQLRRPPSTGEDCAVRHCMTGPGGSFLSARRHAPHWADVM